MIYMHTHAHSSSSPWLLWCSGSWGSHSSRHSYGYNTGWISVAQTIHWPTPIKNHFGW